jgi:membrane dipeptidase
MPTDVTVPTEPDLIHAREVHSKAVVIDAHADIEISGRESPYVGADGRSKVAPDKMEAGDVDAVVMAVASGPLPRDESGYQAARRRADRKLAAVGELIADASNNLVLSHSAEEVRAAKAAGKRSIILGFQNTLIIGTNIAGLDSFYEAGCRVFALNHIGHNDCADSSRPNFIAATGKHEVTEEHGGLSDLGRQAVGRINRLGGLLDVCQLSKNATLQALDISSAPVIVSHSNVRALCDVSRNLSDEEIDRVKDNGGVIHVTPFRGYLYDTSDHELVEAIRLARVAANLPETYLYPFELYWEIKDPAEQLAFTDSISDLLGPGEMTSLIDHIDYLANRIGIDHIGIGTDFNHGGGMKAFDEASDALNVTVALLQRGYSEADIDKIWGQNFLRALSAAQNGAS